MIFRFECCSGTLTIALSAVLLVPVLSGQTSHTLEWRLEEQPASAPCTPEDIAFVNSPEQVSLEKSYILQPSFPLWKCKSIKAPAFNGARVLIVYRPSILDDGEAYTLIQPHGSANVRLLPLGGGLVPMRDTDDWHNRAAMNAIFQSVEVGQPETIDWLGLCLAYLTILDDAPNLADEHYSPGPTDAYFKSYTVPGFLREIPALARKHLLPTSTCQATDCTVHFYYRTEPVEPLKVADFLFRLEEKKVSLLQATVKHYEPQTSRKRPRNSDKAE